MILAREAFCGVGASAASSTANSADVGVDRHVGESVGEGLIGRDRRAELLAGRGVRDGGVERAAGDAREFGGGDDGGLVERGDDGRPVARTPSS